MSVPWSWSSSKCHFNVTEDRDTSGGAQEDILVTESGLSGHVETHSSREGSWDSRVSTRVVIPLGLVTTNNVSRMLELWTEYR